jgi:hypothetical protein
MSITENYFLCVSMKNYLTIKNNFLLYSKPNCKIPVFGNFKFITAIDRFDLFWTYYIKLQSYGPYKTLISVDDPNKFPSGRFKLILSQHLLDRFVFSKQ